MIANNNKWTVAFLTLLALLSFAAVQNWTIAEPQAEQQLRNLDIAVPAENNNLTSTTSSNSSSSTCQEDASGEWTITALESQDGYPAYSELSQFLEGPGLQRSKTEESTHAVCQIRTTPYWAHFPHTMQQMYRCLSYWLAHYHPQDDADDDDRSKPPVLIWHRHKRIQSNAFLAGFVEMLEKSIHLQVVYRDTPEYYDYNETYVQAKNTTSLTKRSGSDDIGITDYALLDPTRQLNRILESQLDPSSFHAAGCGSTNTDSSSKNDSAPSSSSLFPKIAILNRDASSGRYLLNAQELAHTLQSVLFPESPSTATHIPIFTFENKAFLEQAQFMAETDILLSPHGAHLTALPFLPGPCSHVLEFFPKDYLVADYFGSLARSVGVQHSFFYLGEDDDDNDDGNDSNATFAEQQYRRYHFFRSNTYKNQPQCPPQSKVVAAVQQMVQEWRQCCGSGGDSRQ